MTSTKKTIVLGITASIAAFRMCDLILDLKKADIRVLPILSKDAEHFVTPLTIQSLAAEEVYGDLFQLQHRLKPIHIEVAKAADAVVVAPATADIIAKMRMGIADNMLLSTLLAVDVPIIVAPAMNDKMYSHPATQENLRILASRGIKILSPIEGQLVCSDVAMGHIVSNQQILTAILETLK
ncbi:MAG: phosphopantothenoylcysteine decarboxylase/phosphopantothenate--cysteine ligase [Candidatus Omnitrophota bacterium]|jgi:phosphopantothenoylcysteine decarboxylase/phosphopantothenate--cysteine ligase